jgi:ubiquinone/menaquinone biosynthesis C-methylase UbiE
VSGAPWYETFFREPWLEGFLLQIPDQHTAKEAGFVARVLGKPPGAHVLDLCCGIGRHSRALARLGFRVSGLDLSEPSLDVAKARTAEEGLDIEFIHADMRSIPFRDQLDAVVSMYSSFGFLETEGEDERVIREVAAALEPRGRFFLDMSNPLWLFRNYHPQVWAELPDGTVLLEHQVYEVRSGRALATWRLIRPDGQRDEIHFSMRAYTLPELVNMLHRSGLEPVDVWGGFDGSSYGMESVRLMLLAEKRAR